MVYTLMAKNCGHADENYFYNEVKEHRGAEWFLTPEDCIGHKLANKIHIPSLHVSAKLTWKFE